MKTKKDTRANTPKKTQQPAQAPIPPSVTELTDQDLEQVVGGVEQFSRSQSDAQKSVTQNLSV